MQSCEKRNSGPNLTIPFFYISSESRKLTSGLYFLDILNEPVAISSHIFLCKMRNNNHFNTSHYQAMKWIWSKVSTYENSLLTSSFSHSPETTSHKKRERRPHTACEAYLLEFHGFVDGCLSLTYIHHKQSDHMFGLSVLFSLNYLTYFVIRLLF